MPDEYDRKLQSVVGLSYRNKYSNGPSGKYLRSEEGTERQTNGRKDKETEIQTDRQKDKKAVDNKKIKDEFKWYA